MDGTMLLKNSIEPWEETMIKKQMKNHWDNMKKDWILFKKLMRGETGLGWDATKNTIMADDDWWERKIKEDDRYNKFRKIDLSLIWYRYNALFSDIVATGERARAANQEQMSGIRVERTLGVWKARWSILRDMPYYHVDTQRDIVLATMAIHNYIRKKCNVDDAFQTAENESYIPLVDSNDIGITSRANNVDVEDVGEQNDVYWMEFRDMIASDICNA
ncbi:uncharacterized protein LOC132618217 [Lycium barbarum]|uniref:uncharacterized protein LOC132618217 n=1 Tax=Lycium barbarum TaxID=112863 RepID=UPI00293F7841|nr:uncharacterized protein LOC132618217 [Lycium barbarum]